MADTFAGPTFQREAELWRRGHRYIAGIDEAGRGALAGPVAAASVIVPPHASFEGVWTEVRDSKTLSAGQRTTLEAQIQSAALAWGVGMAQPDEIDEIGIAAATRLAMCRALESMSPAPDFLLIDWVRLPQLNIPQESIIKADQSIASVAAASILAKVARDRYMIEAGNRFPVYQFPSNKGYGTKSHLDALARTGPCHIHRFTFAPVARHPTLFDRDNSPDG